jgi:hypothetical protein
MLWLLSTVEKFPRSQKFLLGDRIQGAAFDMIESTYTPNRATACARHASERYDYAAGP